MAAIHVGDVSNATLTVLEGRAARAGQSLQAYIRQLLDDEAAMLTVEEAIEQARSIAARGTVTADDVVEALTEIRETRYQPFSGRRS